MFLICVFPEIDSTQTYAKNFIVNKKSKEEISIIKAFFSYTQNAGVGKLGKKWLSPYGNVSLSFILPFCNFYNLSTIGPLNITIACTLGRLFNKYLQNKAKVSYKWPNDILLDGAKASGILIEIEYDKKNTPYFVIGIGVNLRYSPKVKEYNTSCLYDYTNSIIDPLLFTEEILFNIKNNLDISKYNFAHILAEYNNNLFYLNKLISIKTNNTIHTGILLEVNRLGEVIIENPQTKEVYKISAGTMYNID